MKWLDSVTDVMDMNLSKLWAIVKDWEKGILVCCCPLGHKESDMTQQLKNSTSFFRFCI